jgi:acyl-CoA thioesterase
MSEFDDDTALERRGDRWVGRLNDRWSIGPGRPNGGYIASFLVRALIEASPQPDPLTMTTHYLARPVVGEEVSVRVETLREGRSHVFMEARLEQNEVPVAVSLATFGRRREGGPELVAPMPDVPMPEAADAMRGGVSPEMTFRDRFEWRPPPEFSPEHWGEGGPAVTGGWQRLVDRDPDELTIPLFADAFAPALFRAMPVGGVPTVELTVHWRGRPSGTWLYGQFESRFLTGGYVEEDCELWTDDGRLVAQSRQLALYLPAP